MKLEIVAIHEKGKRNGEYIELKVSAACNLKYYMVGDTTYTSDTSISNKLRHVYWFAPKDVASGDYVFLYTGKGTNTSHKNNAETTTHVFYWGLDGAVWNDTGDAGILFEINAWNTKKA